MKTITVDRVDGSTRSYLWDGPEEIVPGDLAIVRRSSGEYQVATVRAVHLGRLRAEPRKSLVGVASMKAYGRRARWESWIAELRDRASGKATGLRDGRALDMLNRLLEVEGA